MVEKHPIRVSTHVDLLLAIIHFDLRLIDHRYLEGEFLHEPSNQVRLTGIEQMIRLERLDFFL